MPAVYRGFAVSFIVLFAVSFTVLVAVSFIVLCPVQPQQRNPCVLGPGPRGPWAQLDIYLLRPYEGGFLNRHYQGGLIKKALLRRPYEGGLDNEAL